MSLKQPARRAVVGGATSGLGLAAACSLAAQGCGLVLWSRNGERLASVAAQITVASGVAVETIAADAQDPDSAELVAERALAGGNVDIVVLNAGGPGQGDPAQTTAAGWQDAVQMLAITPILLATALLPNMRERGFGRVIAILSSGVVEPIPNLVYSNACRSLLASWLKTVSAAVASDGVTVNGLMPGRIDTPRVASLDSARAGAQSVSIAQVQQESWKSIPTGRYGTPEEFAWLLSALASQEASYVTGQLISVDGGMRKSL